MYKISTASDHSRLGSVTYALVLHDQSSYLPIFGMEFPDQFSRPFNSYKF